MRALVSGTLDSLSSFELPICQWLNRVENGVILALFRSVSWLGDWPLWVLLALGYGFWEGRAAGLALGHVLFLAAFSLPLYKVLKERLARERPYVRHAPAISMLVAPLDRYSFPSGHTLHAVAFTFLWTYHYPYLGWFLVPFTVAVALSRVVLGVHYPSDVAAGTVIGLALAGMSFLVV